MMMSKSDTTPDQLLDDFGFESLDSQRTRLVVQDEKGVLSAEELVNAVEDEEELSFHRQHECRRHRLLVEDGDIDHEEASRSTYELVGDFEQAPSLEVEIPNEGAHREPLPTELSVPADSLVSALDHPEIRSLAADRVAGLDEQKSALRRFLLSDHGGWGLSNRTGVLLEGPPGTGKTELVIETCEELYGGMPVTISGPEILSKWVGESERLLREQFQKARESTSGVLYIDEIDAIARSRSASTHEHSAQLVAQLLVLLDGVDAKTDDAPRVVASTNLSDALDPALLRPGRLGNQPITFARPSLTERMAIVHHYLEQIRTSDDGSLEKPLQNAATDPLESDFLETFARRTDGFTGADIEDTLIAAVSELQTGDGPEGGELTVSMLLDLVGQRDIQSDGPQMSETLVTASETGTIEITGSGQALSVSGSVSDSEREEIAASWQTCWEDVSSPPVLRSVDADELLDPTETATRDRVITAFRDDGAEMLCLYIGGLGRVLRCAERTPLSGTVAETIHEELLRWDERNLLIYESGSDDASLAVDHVSRSE